VTRHPTPPPAAPVRHRVQPPGFGRTLLDYVAERFDTVQRRDWEALMREGRFRSHNALGPVLEPHHVLSEGDTLAVDFPPGMLQSDGLSKAPADLQLLHHDDDIVVVNKAAGLLCYPQGMSTLAAKRYAQRWVSERDGGTLDEADLRPLHRLDKETSGVLMFAKHIEADRPIKRAFERREVAKLYLALVRGWPAEDRFIIEAPLGPDTGGAVRMRRRVRSDGAAALTEVAVLERFGTSAAPFSWLRVQPRTGRTHQIRVHLAHAEHPIVGDKLYTDDGAWFIDFRARPLDEAAQAALGMSRQALHAHSLTLTHPRTGEQLALTAPLHDDMLAFARQHGSQWAAPPERMA